MYFIALSLYNPPSYLLAGISNWSTMERVMDVFMKILFPILVLMIIGTGFMYIHAAMESSFSFCMYCIE